MHSTTYTFQTDVNVWLSYLRDTAYSGYSAQILSIWLLHPTHYVATSLSRSQLTHYKWRGHTVCLEPKKNVMLGFVRLVCSFSSSKCLECPDHWPAFFVSITSQFLPCLLIEQFQMSGMPRQLACFLCVHHNFCCACWNRTGCAILVVERNCRRGNNK